MNLSDYPRPQFDTGFGLHDSASTGSFPTNWENHLKRLKALGVTWYKVLVDGDNKVNWVRFLTKNGIMVIVRMYGLKPHPRFTPDYNIVRQYVEAGAYYFEWGNEPNIGEDEWSSWPGNSNLGKMLVPQWLRCSNEIKKAGGIPLLPAATPGGRVNHREMWRQFFVELKKKKALDSLKGCGLAVHVRPLNNPLDTLREDGNALNRDGVPIFVDEHGEFIRYANTTTHDEYTWFIEFFTKQLGYCPPVFGTEAGYSIDDRQNSSEPPITRETHADWNHELFMRFDPDHPKHWDKHLFMEAYWLDRDGGTWKKDEIERTDLYGRLIKEPPHKDRSSLYNGTYTPPTPIHNLEDSVRASAWQRIKIPYNPEAAYPKLARKYGLGVPVTSEYDIQGFRIQGYTGGIIYCPIGKWNEVKITDW